MKRLARSLTALFVLVFTLPAPSRSDDPLPFREGADPDPTVPTPESILGISIGERPIRHPEVIRYFLDEDPILPNVPTFRANEPSHLSHILANMPEMVIKPANESGGYGMLVGPAASKTEIDKFRGLIQADPRNYVAQPALALSTVPSVCDNEVAPRHVDLRPFVLQGSSQAVTEGGLTRVALRKGSLVVNSSQGGGSKDTWIVEVSD